METDNGRPALHFVLQYNGTEEIVVFYADLPWAWAYACSIVGVTAYADGIVLEQRFPVVHPPIGTIKIRPGQVLEGDEPLDLHMYGFSDALAKGDVVVFWTYRLEPYKGRAFDRAGGWVLMSKK